MVVIKVSLGSDIRRFSVTSVPTFSELRTLLQNLFGTQVAGVYDIKYLDPENDQITVTTDGELLDAMALAPRVGDNQLLRLYLVPKGTNPALMASVVQPSPAPVASSTPKQEDVAAGFRELFTSLRAADPSSTATQSNPLMALLSNLFSQNNAAQPSSASPKSPTTEKPAHETQPAKTCPFMSQQQHVRPDGLRIHTFYVCDGCDSSPIVGNLHQCDICPDYHLCDQCRSAGIHSDHAHSFTVNPSRPECTPKKPHWKQCPRGAASPIKPETPSKPADSQPVSTNPEIPSIPFVKPPVPTVTVPILENPVPKSPGIVETTAKAPITAPVHNVPSEDYQVNFLADVTIPDASEIPAGTVFTKIWRLSNSGTTTWPRGCRLSLVHNTGEKLSSVENIEIPGIVPPGSSVTISVEMEAPSKLGRHLSYWRMHGPSGQPFGSRIWADIISVANPAVQNAPSAPPAQVEEVKPVEQPKPVEKYPSEMEKLWNMGFNNVELNRNLLESNKGNVSTVIEQLLQYCQ